jgi:hypothetical protein
MSKTLYNPLAFSDDLALVLTGLETFLTLKNEAYGDSALNPVRIFSSANPIEQLNVRIDDKLSRIANGDDSEDAELDLIGYLVLKRIAKMREGK